jgi:hypothetical protein
VGGRLNENRPVPRHGPDSSGTGGGSSRSASHSWEFFLEDNFIRLARLGEVDADGLTLGGGQVLADEIGFDGQFAMAAVTSTANWMRLAAQNRSRHPSPRAWSGRYTDVVHQHDRLVRHIEGNHRRLHLRATR